MPQAPNLVPVHELAQRNDASFPNESADYRRARNALLVEEIELRRRIERVAELRRALPSGGEVKTDYRFVGEGGAVTLAQLFRDKDTLVVYSYMFGPQRARPCPMCTSFMGTWEQKMADVEQRVAFAFVARSPIERLVAAKKERGWTRLPVFSDGDGAYTRDYVSRDDEDTAGITVFERRDGIVRHFWSPEMSGEMSDPGQDPRGAPDPDPLWMLLDWTRGGRGDWYPKLEYGPQ